MFYQIEWSLFPICTAFLLDEQYEVWYHKEKDAFFMEGSYAE